MGSDGESRSPKDEASSRDIEYLRDSQYAIADNLNARTALHDKHGSGRIV
jgi:hypothetical protein